MTFSIRHQRASIRRDFGTVLVACLTLGILTLTCPLVLLRFGMRNRGPIRSPVWVIRSLVRREFVSYSVWRSKAERINLSAKDHLLCLALMARSADLNLRDTVEAMGPNFKRHRDLGVTYATTALVVQHTTMHFLEVPESVPILICQSSKLVTRQALSISRSVGVVSAVADQPALQRGWRR